MEIISGILLVLLSISGTFIYTYKVVSWHFEGRSSQEGSLVQIDKSVDKKNKSVISLPPQLIFRESRGMERGEKEKHCYERHRVTSISYLLHMPQPRPDWACNPGQGPALDWELNPDPLVLGLTL